MIQVFAKKYNVAAGEKRHKHEHELGFRLLRLGLEKSFGIEPDSSLDLSVLKGEHGKPSLKDYPHIHYNISHTEGLVICAMGDDPLGVDVEMIRPFKTNIGRRVLSEKEQEFMETLTDERKMEYFFRYWTLKESYVKATGCGITIPLTSISFEITEKEIYSSSVTDTLFCQEILEDKYILSLSILTKEKVSFDKLPLMWI